MPSASISGFAEPDAVFGHRLCVVDDLGGVQQRLRRYAADVQANPADHRVALDQDDVETEVGRAESRRITARTGTQDDQFRKMRRIRPRFGRRLDGAGRCLARCLGQYFFLLFRRNHHRRCRVRCSDVLRRGCFCGTARFDRGDHVARVDLAAHCDVDRDDGAGGRCRNVHRRLVGFQCDQRVLDTDRIAHADQHLDDLHILEVTKFGHLQFHVIGH